MVGVSATVRSPSDLAADLADRAYSANVSLPLIAAPNATTAHLNHGRRSSSSAIRPATAGSLARMRHSDEWLERPLCQKVSAIPQKRGGADMSRSGLHSPQDMPLDLYSTLGLHNSDCGSGKRWRIASHTEEVDWIGFAHPACKGAYT